MILASIGWVGWALAVLFVLCVGDQLYGMWRDRN